MNKEISMTFFRRAIRCDKFRYIHLNKIEEQYVIDLSDYDMWMVDADGKDIDDLEKREQYLGITKQKIGHLLKYET